MPERHSRRLNEEYARFVKSLDPEKPARELWDDDEVMPTGCALPGTDEAMQEHAKRVAQELATGYRYVINSPTDEPETDDPLEEGVHTEVGSADPSKVPSSDPSVMQYPAAPKNGSTMKSKEDARAARSARRRQQVGDSYHLRKRAELKTEELRRNGTIL